MSQDVVPVVVLDTNILLRLGLMQFLLGVAATGAYLPRWTAAIYQELREKLHVRPEPIRERLVDLLEAVPDAQLPVTAADEAAAVGGCDPDDEHVLAAAITARRLVEEDPERWGDSPVLLASENLSDFDSAFASAHGVDVVGPDELGMRLLDINAAAVLRTVQREPAEYYERYLERMRSDGMSQTADEIDRLFNEAI